MRAITKCSAIILVLAAVHNEGCIKCALIGDVVVYYKVYHGLLGVVVGCIIGRYEEKKRA